MLPQGSEHSRRARWDVGRLFLPTAEQQRSKLPTLGYRSIAVEVAYDLDATIITAPAICWDGEALAACRPSKGNRNTVREFLLDILAGGPVLQTVIAERGAEHGFSYDQLKRAKRPLSVRSFKKREAGMDSPWLWALPQHAPEGLENDPE